MSVLFLLLLSFDCLGQNKILLAANHAFYADWWLSLLKQNLFYYKIWIAANRNLQEKILHEITNIDFQRFQWTENKTFRNFVK